MKIDALHMPEAELEIMRLLWRMDKPATVEDIGRGLPHRQWKKSTIHTLAGRLADKGFVKACRFNRKNRYIPYISASDYDFVVAKSFVEGLCGGSLSELMSILLSDLTLTAGALSELQAVVNAAVVPDVSPVSDGSEHEKEIGETPLSEEEKAGCNKASMPYPVYVHVWRSKTCAMEAYAWGRSVRESQAEPAHIGRPDYLDSA